VETARTQWQARSFMTQRPGHFQYRQPDSDRGESGPHGDVVGQRESAHRRRRGRIWSVSRERGAVRRIAPAAGAHHESEGQKLNTTQKSPRAHLRNMWPRDLTRMLATRFSLWRRPDKGDRSRGFGFDVCGGGHHRLNERSRTCAVRAFGDFSRVAFAAFRLSFAATTASTGPRRDCTT